MSMNDLHKAFSIIEANEANADFEGPKPKDLIDEAENALGLAFPPTFKEFLLRLGCGDIGGEEFYGVINSNFESSSVPDAIWLTLNERKVSNLPASLIIISPCGDGSFYAIDTENTDSASENPVILWTPGGVKQDSPIIAADFGQFILNTIRRCLANR